MSERMRERRVRGIALALKWAGVLKEKLAEERGKCRERVTALLLIASTKLGYGEEAEHTEAGP